MRGLNERKRRNRDEERNQKNKKEKEGRKRGGRENKHIVKEEIVETVPEEKAYNSMSMISKLTRK